MNRHVATALVSFLCFQSMVVASGAASLEADLREPPDYRRPVPSQPADVYEEPDEEPWDSYEDEDLQEDEDDQGVDDSQAGDEADADQQDATPVKPKRSGNNWAANAFEMVASYYPYAGLALMDEMQKAIDRALKDDGEGK